MTKQTQYIKLHFPMEWIALAGYDYGLKVFYEQIEPYIDYSADFITIAIPEHIEMVSISFFDGLIIPMLKVLDNMNIVKEKVHIDSPFNHIRQKYLELE